MENITKGSKVNSRKSLEMVISPYIMSDYALFRRGRVGGEILKRANADVLYIFHIISKISLRKLVPRGKK